MLSISINVTDYPRCGLEKETVLHTIIQCPEVSEIWAYAKHLSRTRRVVRVECKNYPARLFNKRRLRLPSHSCSSYERSSMEETSERDNDRQLCI